MREPTNYLAGVVRTPPRAHPPTPKIGAPPSTLAAKPSPRLVDEPGRQMNAGAKPTKALSRGGVAIMGKLKGKRIV